MSSKMLCIQHVSKYELNERPNLTSCHPTTVHCWLLTQEAESAIN